MTSSSPNLRQGQNLDQFSGATNDTYGNHYNNISDPCGGRRLRGCIIKHFAFSPVALACSGFVDLKIVHLCINATSLFKIDTMKFPFTIEQFLDVFRNYNQSVFPMQIVLYLLAALVVFLSTKKTVNSNRLINLTLSFFWLWMGIVYHLSYFAEINKAAYVFAAAFVLQGLLFFYYGVIRNKLTYRFYFDKSKLTGAILVIYALILYPLLGYLLGHQYPTSPTFGVPCPTTIFTFGILLWYDKKLPTIILIIPFLWSMIGFLAAIKLGIREDIGLFVAGLLTLVMLLFSKKNIQLSSN